MAKIQLTPSELQAQAAEMAALKAEYESLFSGVKGIMSSVNNNWSTNLAHNFSGKISSAQKSFSNVVNLLDTGAQAARKSAQSLSTLDNTLAKAMNGQGKSDNGANGSGEGGGGFRGEKNQSIQEQLLDQLKSSWKESGESVKYLEKEYEKLPDWLREKIETLAGEDMRTALKITGDILKGDISLNTLSTYLSGIGMENPYVSGTIKGFDMIINKKGTFGEMIRGYDFFMEEASQAGISGDVGGTIKNLGAACGVGLLGIAYGVFDVSTELLGDALTYNIDKTSELLGKVGSIMPGNTGEFICDVSDDLDNVTGSIKDVFYNMFQ